MRHLLIALMLWATSLTAQPTGPVLLTVGGAVSDPTLSARSEDDGGLFAFFEVTYPAAAGFDAQMLNALPQHDLTVPFAGQDAVAFRGPLLQDVLAFAGAKGSLLRAVGLDGYQAEIPMALIQDHPPILATHMNGAPMGLGGYGPAAIIFPHSPEHADALEALQVWALIFIGIE